MNGGTPSGIRSSDVGRNRCFLAQRRRLGSDYGSRPTWCWFCPLFERQRHPGLPAADARKLCGVRVARRLRARWMSVACGVGSAHLITDHSEKSKSHVRRSGTVPAFPTPTSAANLWPKTAQTLSVGCGSGSALSFGPLGGLTSPTPSGLGREPGTSVVSSPCSR